MKNFLIVLIFGLSSLARQAEAKQILFDNEKNRTQALSCNNAVNGIHSFGISSRSPNGPITLMHILYDAQRVMPVTSTVYHDSMNAYVDAKRIDKFRKYQCDELAQANQPACSKTFAMTPAQQQFSGLTAFQRGHLFPVNPALFDQEAANNTFYCVNIAPQEGYTNQGPWSVIEKRVLDATKDGLKGYVMTGMCSKDSADGPTADNIRVPNCFWKLFCYTNTTDSKPYVVGFIGENTLIQKNDQITKDKRSKETLEPRSQREVISRANANLIRQAWTESEGMLLSNRDWPSAPQASSCIALLDLPENIKQNWRAFLKETSSEIEYDESFEY